MNQFENLKKNNELELIQCDNKIKTLESENNNLNFKFDQEKRKFQLEFDEKNEYTRLLQQKVIFFFNIH